VIGATNWAWNSSRRCSASECPNTYLATTRSLRAQVRNRKAGREIKKSLCHERSVRGKVSLWGRLGNYRVVFPHEHELETGVDVTAAWIFAQDRSGIERADAMLAMLDGPSVDDGTACEIGMFHALMQSDPSKKGIVGLLTDIRGMRGESTGVNLFVQGAIEDVGRIVASIEEARDVLRAWR